MKDMTNHQQADINQQSMDTQAMGSRDAAVYCAQGPQYLAPLLTEHMGSLSNTSFVVKDLFDIAGYVTGAGNPTWLRTHDAAAETSPLVEALLEAGATCHGRVQTDELAYSLNGQNYHYGTPVNPKAPACLPGGSSSGSAVAVARGDVDFALGTDTGGSVRVPASYCGLYGVRPTWGQFSLDHCFELARSFDTAGIFTRDLNLMATLIEELATYTLPAADVTTLIIDQLFVASLGAQRQALIESLCDKAGLTLIYRHDFSEWGWTLARLSEVFRTIQGFEIIECHSQWLDEYEHTLDPAIAERVSWARTITAVQYADAVTQQAQLKGKMTDAWLSEKTLALLPTTPGTPPPLMMSADELATYRCELMGLTAVAGLSGFPQLHVPLPDHANGPWGFSLIAGAWKEQTLVAVARQLSDVM